ncbi:Hsp70 family protein [Pseudonocardia xishanensis]|uniref:Hsp70 protein n=1 Tax=Pseudonocardia xishanensis TaxID=630995 RepID=A0ABP8S246_9PSEU
MNPYLLGVDVGTTRTAAAIGRPGGAPEAVPLGERAVDMPSVVYLGEDDILVGEAAERFATTEPERVAREFKRRVGDPTPIVAGGRGWSPEELCALLVRRVVDQVAAREGGPAERIAVTHPAAWGEHKRELFAGALLDQGVSVTLLAEPQAAALHYAANERLHPGAIVAVYDLGGGTFDAAVVQRDVTGFSLLGRPEGLEHLGGVDFDQAVFDHVAQGAPAAFETLDDTDPEIRGALAALRRECAEAKEALSADTEVSVRVPLPGAGGSVRLHRSEFEREIRSSIEETVAALRRAVASAGVTPEALAAVLLVGGSSRIPLVPQLVSQELGRPVAVDAEPKQAVAKGAVAALGATRNGAMAVQGTGDFATPPTGTGRYPSEAPTAYAPLGAEAATTYAPGPEAPTAYADPYADPGYGLFSGPNSDARTELLPTDEQQTRFAPAPPPPPGSLFDSYADYETDRPKGRSPILVVAAGGLVAALAVIGAVAFWPEGPSSGNAANRVDTSAIAPAPEAPVATLPPVAEETTEADAPIRRTPTTTRRVVPTTTPVVPVVPVEPTVPIEPTTVPATTTPPPPTTTTTVVVPPPDPADPPKPLR